MYECPNCGANLKFDIPSQQLGCDHCGTKIDPYAFQKERDAEEVAREGKAAGGEGAVREEAAGEEGAIREEAAGEEYEVTVFTCPQCGGELISDDTTAATFCSFCGGATILDSRISRERKPQFIIPFQKTKEDCKKAYVKMMRRAIFAPSDLKNGEQIEHFRSIYMPYWIYHFEKDSPVLFHGTTTRQRGNYEYTAHYQIESDLYADFKGISFDASASFSDNLSNAIAPFEWEKAKRFTPSFLSGFYADTSDVGYDAYEEKAKKYVMDETRSNMEKNRQCRKYHLSGLDSCVSPDSVERELAMFPVWFLAYRKKDRVCYAVVNGQTGKAAADVPIDWKKYLIGSLIVALPIFLLLNLFFTMHPIIMLIWSGILAAICCKISIRQEKELKVRESDADDEGMIYYKKQFQLAEQKEVDWEHYKKVESVESLIRALILMGGFTFLFPMLFMISAFHSSPAAIIVLPVFFIAWPMLLIPKKSKVSQMKSASAVERQQLTKKEWFLAVLKPGIGAIIALLVILYNPVSDLYYYGAAAAAMGLIGWNFVDIITRYNLIVSRKLPQFNRRGGEENV